MSWWQIFLFGSGSTPSITVAGETVGIKPGNEEMLLALIEKHHENEEIMWEEVPDEKSNID